MGLGGRDGCCTTNTQFSPARAGQGEHNPANELGEVHHYLLTAPQPDHADIAGAPARCAGIWYLFICTMAGAAECPRAARGHIDARQPAHRQLAESGGTSAGCRDLLFSLASPASPDSALQPVVFSPGVCAGPVFPCVFGAIVAAGGTGNAAP